MRPVDTFAALRQLRACPRCGRASVLHSASVLAAWAECFFAISGKRSNTEASVFPDLQIASVFSIRASSNPTLGKVFSRFHLDTLLNTCLPHSTLAFALAALPPSTLAFELAPPSNCVCARVRKQASFGASVRASGMWPFGMVASARHNLGDIVWLLRSEKRKGMQ